MSGVSLQRTGGANRRVGTRVKTRHPQSGEQRPGEPPEETAAQEELPWAQQSSRVRGIPEKTLIPSTQHTLACLGIFCPDRDRQHDSVTAGWDPRTARASTPPAAAPQLSAAPQGCHASTDQSRPNDQSNSKTKSVPKSPLDHSSFRASSPLHHGLCGLGEEEGQEEHRPRSKRFPRS
ncbi:hypothetical protein R6Z07M_006255 [Ovis aries]